MRRIWLAALWAACSDGARGWTEVAPLAGGARQEIAVAAAGGRVYVLGGFVDAGLAVDTVEAYDPARDEWLPRKRMPVALHHVNVAAVGDKLYVTGGIQGLAFIATGNTYEYDPVADEWTAKRTMPVGSERGASGVAVIGAKIYLAGGLRGVTVADFSVYDTVADEWETLETMPVPRDHLVGGAVAGTAYFIGGRHDILRIHSPRVFAYEPGAGWSERAPMLTSRGGAAAGVVGGRIVVAGGDGSTGQHVGAFDVFSQVEAFDPAANEWVPLPPMPTPRRGTGAGVVGDMFYVPSGAIGTGFGGNGGSAADIGIRGAGTSGGGRATSETC